MSTYKIGNHVTGIIRAFTPTTIGEMTLTYKNQPYTLLKDVDVTLTFAEYDKKSDTHNKNLLEYNFSTLKSVSINNVKLTDKILDLLYQKNTETPLLSDRQEYTSDDDGLIYLNCPSENIYQVFVYDNKGICESAYGSYDNDTLTVDKQNTDYVIYYSYVGNRSFLLDKPSNIYVSLDLLVIGNENDNTKDMCIHIEKCVLTSNNNMYFNNNNSNAVDITANVIYTGEDYITVK